MGKFLLPVDTLITDSLDFDAKSIGESKVTEGDIPDGWEGVDIGPETIKLYQDAISGAETILWNGPMGVLRLKSQVKEHLQSLKLLLRALQFQSLVVGIV